MYLGSYQAPLNLVTTVESTEDLDIGHLVAVHCEDCPTEPAIGEVMELGRDNVQIKWLKGTYSTSWEYYKIPDERDRRRKVNWEQNIPRSSILLYNFQLTKTKHLRKKTISKLKELYAQEHISSSP